MAKALGIGGVFFRSDDPQRLTDWYAAHLGLQIDDFGGARFDPRALPAETRTAWSPFQATTEYFAPSTRDFMLNLVVDDVDAALRQVAAAGGKVYGKVEQYDNYGRFGWFVDPDGNKIELWEPSSTTNA
jgi:predicted enzyme related to lactoylglutathione lyase